MTRKFLYATVFISGMTSLAVEMAASRLLGNVFGTSNLVWASIIGLILIYLALGNYLGGAWADRSPHFTTFYQILLWASLGIALAPVLSRPVLRMAANAFDQLQMGILFGSFIAVFILLCVPVTLLGTASPFAIRLAILDNRSAGSISGRIYAISTLGSFIGAFIPVLVLIPLVGTYRTFLVISAVLLGVALSGLIQAGGWRLATHYAWMPLVVAGLYFVGLPGSDKASTGQIYETESSYNYIQVLEQDDYRLLRLNDGQGVHSIYHPEELSYTGPWEQVLAAPFFNPAPYDPQQLKSLAIVGLAAGTTARQATAAYGPIAIDGIEIDPKIVEVGYEYFGMDLPNLNVIVQDGRWGLAHSDKRYQVISVDAYRPPYIPWHMTTREFFQVVYDHLTEDGVLVINVGRSPDDRRLVDALGSTILSVFPTIHVIDVPNSFNTIIYASVQPTSFDNLAQNYGWLASQEDTHPLLLKSMQIALTNMQPDPPPGEVFTDDLAPVEWITNTMILDFLFTGDMEMIQ
jgi:spermidine synthase